MVTGQPSLLFGALKLPSQDQKLPEYMGLQVSWGGAAGELVSV